MDMSSPQSNENEDLEPEGLIEAADDMPTDVTAPELSEETKELTEWNEPPTASGTEVPKVRPDDETSIAEQLVYEGTDEAERERRIAAADPDFEP